MSDNDESDYYSDSSESDEELIKPSNKTPILINAAKKFGGYAEESSDSDDDEVDGVSEHDDEQIGGVEDILDDEDDVESVIKDDEDEDDAEPEEAPDSDIEIDEEGEVLEKQTKTIKPKKITQVILADDDDDEDDEYEENYLQKFDNEVNRNYIVDFHPECLNHNNDEVSKLSKVIRDEDNIIIDPLHRTIPYLTKYEKARILGQRAKQIETGAKPFVKVPENIIDSYVIAELELREKKIPFIIKRPIPGGAFEYWNLKDLENILF
jgi:DNA-directed RNA polymerase I, II, and III subunit RPABC2